MRLVPKQEQKSPPNWLWILVIGSLLAAVLFAAFSARGQEEGPLACPPEFAECHAKVQAPASPSVDHVCLRKLGATVQDPTLCKPVKPNEIVSIQFPKPAAGTDHVRYEAVACDEELNICSAPASRTAIAVDLSAPAFLDVLRAAFEALKRLGL